MSHYSASRVKEARLNGTGIRHKVCRSSSLQLHPHQLVHRSRSSNTFRDSHVCVKDVLRDAPIYVVTHSTATWIRTIEPIKVVHYHTTSRFGHLTQIIRGISDQNRDMFPK